MNNINTNNNNLKLLQEICLTQNIPFVSYRLPLENDIITFIQHNSFPETIDSLENIDAKKRFIFAPFTQTTVNQTYLLSPDATFISNDIDDSFIKELSENKKFSTISKKEKANISSTTASEFILNVNKAIDTIKKGQLQKVVLSKVRVEKRRHNFKPESFFLDLCNKYPHAMVYLIQLPDIGCWIGATPEPLLQIENECVQTVSLAGTQLASKEKTAYQWSPKEIEEQGIVTDFVEQTLRSLEVKSLSKIGPVNYQAANLIHLKTSFEFPKTELNNKLGNFIQALHPTPSVGGMPKSKALNFILSNEKHDRAYYTGFLGPVNIDEKSAIFVNLRCLQLFEKQIVLYSGAGITASSVAENEWEETENKIMTMMNVMTL